MLATVLWGRATGLAITAALTAVLCAVTAQGGRPTGGAAKPGVRPARMPAVILHSGTLRADRRASSKFFSRCPVMEALVFETPYQFVPPYEGRFWPTVLQQATRWYLRWQYGITEFECRGLDRLRAARAAGHSILLAPNHCRPCDAFVVSELARRAGTLPYVMGSWHLFMQGRFQSWVLRRAGVFSIYREGVDRAAPMPGSRFSVPPGVRSSYFPKESSAGPIIASTR